MEICLNRVLKAKLESVAQTTAKEMGISGTPIPETIPETLRLHRGLLGNKRLETLFTRTELIRKGICPGLCVPRMEGANVFLDLGILSPDVKGHGEQLDREVEESQDAWKELNANYKDQFFYVQDMFIITAEKSKESTIFSTALELGIPDTKRKELTGRTKSINLQLQIPFEDLSFYWTLHNKERPEKIKLLLNSRGVPIYIPSFYQEKAQIHLKTVSKMVNVAGLGNSHEKIQNSNPLNLPHWGDIEGMERFTNLLKRGKAGQMKQEVRQDTHEYQERRSQEDRLRQLQISKLERQQEREHLLSTEFPTSENIHISTPITQHKTWNTRKHKGEKSDQWYEQDTENKRWNDPNQPRIQKTNRGRRYSPENDYEAEDTWYPQVTTENDYNPLNMRHIQEGERENPPVKKKWADKLMWEAHGEFEALPHRNQRNHPRFPNTDSSVNSQETDVQTRKQDTRVFHNRTREKKLENQNQEEKRTPHRNRGGEERQPHPQFWNIKNELDKVNQQSRGHDPSEGNHRSLDLQIQDLEQQLHIQKETNKRTNFNALAQIDKLEKDNQELQRQFATQSTTTNQLDSKVKHLLAEKERQEVEHDKQIKQREEDKANAVQIINSLDCKVEVLIRQIKSLLKSEKGYEEAIEDFQKNQSLLEDTIANQSNQMQIQKEKIKDLEFTITNLQLDLEISRSQTEAHTDQHSSEKDKNENTEVEETEQTKGEPSKLDNQEHTITEESLEWDNFSSSQYENTRVTEQQVTEEIERMMSEERSSLSMELRKAIHPPDRYSP